MFFFFVCLLIFFLVVIDSDKCENLQDDVHCFWNTPAKNQRYRQGCRCGKVWLIFDCYYLVFLYSTRIVFCQADEKLLSFEVFRALIKSVQYYRVSSVKGSYWSESMNTGSTKSAPRRSRWIRNMSFVTTHNYGWYSATQDSHMIINAINDNAMTTSSPERVFAHFFTNNDIPWGGRNSLALKQRQLQARWCVFELMNERLNRWLDGQLRTHKKYVSVATIVIDSCRCFRFAYGTVFSSNSRGGEWSSSSLML